MYCSCADRRALALAASALNSFCFWVDWVEKNAEYSVPLQCTRRTRPASDSSFSRRSVIVISVGHLCATPPSSLLKVWVGKHSTSPAPSHPSPASSPPTSSKPSEFFY